MDTQQYAGLVYHHHPGSQPLSAGEQSYPYNIHPSPHDMSWKSQQAPLSTSSSSSDHQMYSTSQDYASQPSSPFDARHSQNIAHQHHSQSFDPHESTQDAAFGSSQIESNIGPTRILTRRRARAVAQSQPGPSNMSEESIQQQHSMSYHSSEMSRPRSPGGAASQYPDQQDQSSGVHEGSSSRGPAHSMYPLTRFPPQSGYSPYTFYPSHSRSTSGSTSNPRSASPALSNASTAITSVSSGSAPNSQCYGAPPMQPSPLMPTRVKHRKSRLFNTDRRKICMYHEENPTVKQEDIARRFHVERSTVSKILKHKQKWLNVPEGTPHIMSRQRPTKFPYLELKLERWLEECQRNKVVFTDALIRDKAKELAREMQWPEEKFKASSGWVENFKHRHGIRKGVWHGFGTNLTNCLAVGFNPNADDDEPPVHNELPAGFPGSYMGQHGAASQGIPTSMPTQRDPDHEMGAESEDDDEEMPRGVMLQPAWQNSSQGSADAPAPQGGPLPLINAAAVADPHEPLSAPLPMPEPVPIPIHNGGDAGDGEPEVYVNVLPTMPTYRPPPGVPTMDEVEEAIDRVLAFVDAHQGLIPSEERDMLTSVKCAIFQFASGIPFNRNRR